MVLVSRDNSAVQVFLSLLFPGLAHFLLGHLLEPRLVGDSLELHPITVLLCLIFWGMVWGIPGLVLAAPMTAALKIMCESIEVTAPFALLLAGQIEGRAEGEDVELGGGSSTKDQQLEIDLVEGASELYRSATTVMAQISGVPAQKVASS